MIILRANYESTVGYWAVITPWLTNGCVLGKPTPVAVAAGSPPPCATQRCAQGLPGSSRAAPLSPRSP